MFEFFKTNFSIIIIKKSDIFVQPLKPLNKTEIFMVVKNSVHLKLEILIDMFVCDFIFYKKRFKVCYNISSLYYINNLFFSFSLKILDSWISSWNIFKSSIWMEREVYDMFGIKFINNWDLRKILTDYTFFGFPLRKDFPLSGYTELYYDEKKKSTFETLVEFMQEFRFYIASTYIEFWDLH